MKQTKFFGFCLAAALVSFGLTACSDDDKDDNNGGNGNAANVNPGAVFTAGLPKSANGAIITTNAKGQVVSINDEGDIYTFNYEPTTFKGKNYDATLVVTESSRADNEAYRFYLKLDKQNFVTYAYQEYVGENEYEEWWFGYNNDGQLNYMKRSEGGNEETTITYTDGNITKVSTVELDDDNDTPSVVTIAYTNSAVTTPIVNKGAVMLFDETFDIDMDEFAPVYYAGMLGKATKHLPLVQTDVTDAGYYEIYNWTFANDLPVKMTPTYYSPYGEPYEGYESYTFTW